VTGAEVHRVTSDLFNAGNPAWGPDGNYLYYTANHDFQPALSQIEFNYATDRGDGIFALALRKDVKNPFPPESDEVTISKEGDKPAATDSAKAEDKKPEKQDEKKEEKKTKNRRNTSTLITMASPTALPAFRFRAITTTGSPSPRNI